MTTLRQQLINFIESHKEPGSPRSFQDCFFNFSSMLSIEDYYRIVKSAGYKIQTWRTVCKLASNNSQLSK